MEKEIIQKIIELVNKGHYVCFEEDLGGNTLTLYIDEKHTHCGVPDGSYEVLIKSLYDTLINNKGLTFA